MLGDICNGETEKKNTLNRDPQLLFGNSWGQVFQNSEFWFVSDLTSYILPLVFEQTKHTSSSVVKYKNVHSRCNF